MYKHKIIFVVLMTLVIGSSAYSQQNPEHQKIEETSGTVVKVDAQGGVLDLSSFQGQMAFSVPKNAIITRETYPATLADVREGDSAAIRYYTSSSAVYVVLSIIDSKPVEK